jgi:hypothetical protein
LLLVPALGAFSCRLSAKLPDGDGYASLIVAEESGGALLGVYAFSSAHPDELPTGFSPAARLTVLFYSKTLAELGIGQEGPLLPAAPGALASPLPPADAIWRSDPERRGGSGGIDLGWTKSASRSAALDALWIAGAPPMTDPCPTIELHPVRLHPGPNPPKDWVTIEVPYHDRSVLVAVDDGFYAVTATGATLLAFDPKLPHGAAFKSSDGAIWLSGCEQTLVEIDPEGRYPAPAAGAPPACNPRSGGDWLGGRGMLVMDGSVDDGPLEFFGVTRRGRFFRFGTSGSWEVLLDPQIPSAMYFNYAEWVARGEGIHTHKGPGMNWVVDGIVSEVMAPALAADDTPEIDRAVRVPGGILVAEWTGSANAFFMVTGRDAPWHLIAQQDLGGTVWGLAPAGDGFVYAGATGVAGWYRPSTGLCPATPPDAFRGFTSYFLVTVGPDAAALVGFGQADNMPTDEVWWMTRR